MKKATFFSRMSYGVEEHIGYTDGNFWYYKAKNGGLWHAVHPDNGLSVAQGHTLKEAASTANNPETVRKIVERLKVDGPRLALAFKKLISDYNLTEATA